jgi:hypothetical protein
MKQNITHHHSPLTEGKIAIDIWRTISVVYVIEYWDNKEAKLVDEEKCYLGTTCSFVH